MSSPDIKKASALKPILYVLGGLTTLFASAIAVTYLVYDDTDGLSENEDSIFQRGLPDDFFWSEEKKRELAEQESDPDSIPTYLQVEEEKVEEQNIEPVKPKKTVAKKKKVVKKKPPRVETAAELFGAVTVSSSSDQDDRFRDVINKARLSAGATYVQREKAGDFTKLEKSADDDWTQYGVKKDKGSYPVDMERVITADRNIRCILIEEISSELEGKITCLVEENVYGAHGRFVLIPAGSKAIGYYAPLKKVGDARLFSGWNRLITPDGINVIFSGDDKRESALMADAMGRAGVGGDVNNKYFEKYGLAFMVASMNALAGSQIVTGDANQQIVIENYGREIGQLSNTILNENINIKPVVTVPAGSRVLISPLVDIWFQEPKGKEIKVKTI